MLCKGLKGLVLVAALAGVAQARADEDEAGPTQDLTPVSLQFSRVAGEFGGESLRISLGVKNVGTLPVRGSRGGIQIGSIVNPSAALYGPSGGGYNLGAPIAPGATGMFLIDAPVGSLRHCQIVSVRIDTAHTLQSGPSRVFYNDTKRFLAHDPSSLRPCVGPIHGRFND